MSKGDRKGSNKASNEPDPVPIAPAKRGAKRAGATIAKSSESIVPHLPETSKAKKENKPTAEGPKPLITPLAPEADNHTDKGPVPENTAMEVHHHPQLEHKPKPFKEYLLEGFMIFIAVMMGFIAENIREAIDNREHVEQLTSQLVHDLKADTAQISEIYREETKVSRYNDTLFALLQQPLQKADMRKIQMMVTQCHSMWPFHPSTGAMAAIKNELHLKQFSNSKLLSYFAAYEKHSELVQTAQDITLQYQRTYLDPFITLHFKPANMASAFEIHTVQNGEMRNLTQNDLDQLAADVVLMRVTTREILRDHRWLKSDAINMLRYVIKQYGLKEE